jgi:hypothetical protein
MSALRNLTVASALLLATAGSAGAESIATGCLSASGTISSVNPFSNNPKAACRNGEQIIRFAVQQPDTKFSKKRVVLPFGGGGGSGAGGLATFQAEFGPVNIEARFEEFAIGNEPTNGAPATNACELFITYDEIVYVLATTEEQPSPIDGIGSFLRFNQDGRLSSLQRFPTRGTIREPHDDWAVRIHDLVVVLLRPEVGGGCFISYEIEFADDPAALYSR